MLRLICALILMLLIATPSLGQQSLIGTYKLASLVVEIDGTPREVMGKAPHGYLMITPTHFMTFFTSGDRQFGTSVDEKAALFDTLVGFAGTYRIEGHAFVRTDDVSWTENMNGKTVVQMYHISGNLLTLTHGPIPWPVDPSKTWTCRQVWEKIE